MMLVPLRTLSHPACSDIASNVDQPSLTCHRGRSDSTAASDAIANKLMVYYQNVRGLRTKIDDFFVTVVDCDYDVIVVTETWLDDRIYSAQLFGNRFTVFRNDRNPFNSTKARGGGVLIAVSNRLNYLLDSAHINTSVEQLWVKVTTPN